MNYCSIYPNSLVSELSEAYILDHVPNDAVNITQLITHKSSISSYNFQSTDDVPKVSIQYNPI